MAIAATTETKASAPPFKFQWPFSLFLAGPSHSGKSFLVRRIIEWIDELVEPLGACEKILYCYSIYQPLYNEIGKISDKVLFHEGIPTMEDIKELNGVKTLIILDDLAREAKDDKIVTDLFTKIVHHYNCSTIFITQNAFLGSRTSRVNATYLVLTKNNCDKNQIRVLSQQLFPENRRYLLDTYTDVCKEKWPYLVIDNHINTDEKMRLVTKIFPNDGGQVFYIPRH